MNDESNVDFGCESGFALHLIRAYIRVCFEGSNQASFHARQTVPPGMTKTNRQFDSTRRFNLQIKR